MPVMRKIKTLHVVTLAALGAAFAFFTSKSSAANKPDDAESVDPRVHAFLDMIGVLETDSADSYDVFYGGSRFSDFSDHPSITGEKIGVPLPVAVCRAAGIASGACVSTAAGKYQINEPTWRDVRAQYPALSDFSPASQDAAAIRLLQKTGALDALLRDDFDAALRLASTRWASLPYSTAQQNPKSYAYALAQYLNYLEA